MEFPFGHNHRCEEEQPNRYPPPSYHPDEYPLSPPPAYGPPGYSPVQNVYEQSGPAYGPPPPSPYQPYAGGPVQNAYRENYGSLTSVRVFTVTEENYSLSPIVNKRGRPPAYGSPGYSPVQTGSHHSGPGYGPTPPSPYQPYAGEPAQNPYPNYHQPSHAHHTCHENYGSLASVLRQTTVRVFTVAEENYSLSIRDGQVVLAPANPRDEYQHWIKDLKFSTMVKDEEGLPGFALVNKVTGQAIKHSIGATYPVRLVPYNPDYLDESVLWSESYDTGEGFRCIRMVNNIRLNFDAFHGDEDHGGVRDGTTVVLWEWLKGKNQRWKIAPY